MHGGRTFHTADASCEEAGIFSLGSITDGEDESAIHGGVDTGRECGTDETSPQRHAIVSLVWIDGSALRFGNIDSGLHCIAQRSAFQRVVFRGSSAGSSECERCM